jgi:hypothetical protein
MEQVGDGIAAVPLGRVAGRQVDEYGPVCGFTGEIAHEGVAVDGDFFDAAFFHGRLGGRTAGESEERDNENYAHQNSTNEMSVSHGEFLR